MAFKAAIAQSLQQRIWPLLAVGRIKPVIYRVFAADGGSHAQSGAAQAHALMESGVNIGKIVLTW